MTTPKFVEVQTDDEGLRLAALDAAEVAEAGGRKVDAAVFRAIALRFQHIQRELAQLPPKDAIREFTPQAMEMLDRGYALLITGERHGNLTIPIFRAFTHDGEVLGELGRRLRELLRIEFLRHDHLELPWKCIEADCPRFGKSLYLTGCNCVNEFKAKHIAAVKKELGL